MPSEMGETLTVQGYVQGPKHHGGSAGYYPKGDSDCVQVGNDMSAVDSALRTLAGIAEQSE
jgi:hypothetical protein